jgi:hypothetical protein
MPPLILRHCLRQAAADKLSRHSIIFFQPFLHIDIDAITLSARAAAFIGPAFIGCHFRFHACFDADTHLGAAFAILSRL